MALRSATAPLAPHRARKSRGRDAAAPGVKIFSPSARLTDRKQLNVTVENGELADATLRLASPRLRGVT
ncbi:hypothetical protein EYF80_013380 [Liparis tanakae]|uniref:Uncharacterized protein n=1 Tax=Liparis tanakae TaxID=230148 RepID=A0A4Z2IFV6_9TELE|nr:hypothetical protein EYF80_013380 [Liparis tanakae]